MKTRTGGLAMLGALVATLQTGCYGWEVIPVTRSSAQLAGARDQRRMLRFTRLSGEQVVMSVHKLDFPHVRGVTDDGKEKEIDINQVTKVEVFKVEAGKTAMVVMGVAVGVAAVISVVVIASQSHDTEQKENKGSGHSCPFVYVDRGQGLEFVGEAYSGAVFRALQREDLLPLPDGGEARALRVRMTNEQLEIDWTDMAQLVVVDHDLGTRVVTRGASGPPMVVGPAIAPRWAKDLSGHDVTALIRLEDARAWQSDLRAARRRTPPLREGVIARFEHTPARPVLELTLANSYWLEFVVARFFALFGERYGSYSRSIDRDATLRWRAREGVDLAVEVRAGDGWKHVATLPAVGPTAFRRVAVPLNGADEGPIQVRVSGGLGFWRVDRVALSPRLDGPRHIATIVPAQAVDHAGRDQLPAITATDGRYQVLARSHEHLDLRFHLRPHQPGQARALFLRTSGYYVPDPPHHSRASIGTARTIIRREGSLARFGLDLFDAYERLLRQ